MSSRPAARTQSPWSVHLGSQTCSTCHSRCDSRTRDLPGGPAPATGSAAWDRGHGGRLRRGRFLCGRPGGRLGATARLLGQVHRNAAQRIVACDHRRGGYRAWFMHRRGVAQGLAGDEFRLARARTLGRELARTGLRLGGETARMFRLGVARTLGKGRQALRQEAPAVQALR